jgi:hypothetical protein
MFMRMFRTFGAVALSAAFALGSIGSTAPTPALADFNYTQYSSLFGILAAPDFCAFGGCVLLGSFGTELNTYSQIMNQVQQAEMQVQDLQSGPLGRLGGMGVGDPVSGGMLGRILGQVASGARTNQSLTCSNALQTSGTGNRTDLLSLFGVQQGSGVGNLSSNQISSVVMQKIAGAMEAQNQCKAAEAQSQQANVERSYYNAADELDLNGPTDMGWMLN